MTGLIHTAKQSSTRGMVYAGVMITPSSRAAGRGSLLPKLWTVLRAGYRPSMFWKDTIAGATVAVVALPLAMAIAIASGASPEQGLLTAVVAGFLISALGGSRVQIGGPTGAFIPVVYLVVTQHGYDGLVLATVMAGLMLMLAGWLRIGGLMKYIPQPVITGFTAGIAVIIASSQLKDFLGLQLDQWPADFLPKLVLLATHVQDISAVTLGLGLMCLLAIVGLRLWRPSWPGFLLVILLAALLVPLLNLSVETIGSRYGAVQLSWPVWTLPDFSLARVRQMLPAAFTIAFLAGIESLLSAVVADGMTGHRHRSNAELMAQGVANVASGLCGGMPATGAIARTATNVRAGAVSPVAGMLHALFVLVFVLVLAPWLGAIPLAALAAVLLVVAWNMSEHERIRHFFKSPIGDRAVLGVTFLLTVFADLTLAIEVGVVLASFLFMHRMARVVEFETQVDLLHADEEENEGDARQRARVPAGVEVYQLNGPLFFGITSRLEDLLESFTRTPKVFILRMRLVPIVDASGALALSQLAQRLRDQGVAVILSGLQPQPKRVLENMGMLRNPDVASKGWLQIAPDFDAALLLAEQLVGQPVGQPGAP